MSEKYDIIIIGAGLGGLLCGNILSREGYNVCILEQGSKIGGSIQSFTKDKTIFNTGLNYTESLGEGEILNTYFKYFQIMDKLKIKRMDAEAFNKISFGNSNIEYPYAQGRDNFIDRLAYHFPKERENIKVYMKKLREVCDMFPYYTLKNHQKSRINGEVLQKKAHDFVIESVGDPILQQVLGGMNPLFGAVKDRTPLYMHALINYSFIKSAWKFVNGSSQLAARISSVIKANGGQVLLNSKVKEIGGNDKKVGYVMLENGREIFANVVISNAHPAVTLSWVNPKLTKKAHKRRISKLENTVGMFTLYAVLKKDSFPYLNYNHHYYASMNAWTYNYKKSQWPEHYFLYTPATSKSDIWADGLVAMTYMDYKEVAKWENTRLEDRGEEYLDFKAQKAEMLLDSIEKKFPSIRKSISCYYTSTPLTYRDYTGTPQGTSYGILKNCQDPLSTIINPKSRVNGLYFTGQNLNMHGILGVTIGAVLTCSELVGKDYLFKKIQNG